MKLTYFGISDYRSITKAAFNNLPNVTTLIGANNEGKSNVLESLKLCLELLRSDRIVGGTEKVKIRSSYQNEYDWDSDFPVKKQKRHPNGASVFDLHFELTLEEADRFQKLVRSKLNGILPIELRFDEGAYVEFRVTKQGPGGASLSRKAAIICKFISENLDFAHVPAIRTAETSQNLVKDLVARELRILERKPEYAKLQDQLEALQKPILQTIAAKLKTDLTEILGNTLKDVSIKLPRRNQLRAVARAADITIDDGAPTSLERKGDGVKSLVAIGLLTRALQESESAKDVILLIEEPESHLHPKAIHQLKEVLDGLKQDRQIILTTHCPILVNRANVGSNIIVSRNKAKPAKDLEELREVLGVRASDNLRHASLIVVVEGKEDENCLRALFNHYSLKLRAALSDGRLAFEPIGGASKLSYSLNLLQMLMCNYYVLLDDDGEGRRAASEAKLNSLLSEANLTFTKCRGKDEAEFEDLLSEDIYINYFQTTYSVDVRHAPFNNARIKWSERIAQGLQRSGKNWSDADQAKDKSNIADLVEKNPTNAVHAESMTVLRALMEAIEKHLQALGT